MTIPRAASADELTLLRTAGQWSELYLAGTEQPPIVFQCIINQTFSTTDKVVEFLYDTPTGNYLDVLPNMEVWIGSDFGHYDYGIARVRKAWTVNTAYIGEESELPLADNLYVTVVDTMGIWAKHVWIDPVTDGVFMDNDVAFTDQHIDFDPVPVMGSDIVIDAGDFGANLVRNGTFTDSTESWNGGLGTILSIVSNAMELNINGSVFDYVFQNIKTVIGMTYSFTVNVVSFSDNYQVIVGGNVVLDTTDSTGSHTISFVATDTTTAITFRAYGNTNSTLIVDSVDAHLFVINYDLDASDSWVFDSTITAYLWTVSEGTLTNETTAMPSLHFSSYPVNGMVRLALLVTAASGKSFTSYRYVRMYNTAHPAFSDFTLDECGGEFDSGGFSFTVTLVDNATRTLIKDRTQIILWAKDYYGDTKTSIGQQTGRENVIVSGWVDGESINYDLKAGSVTFTVQGPHFWMDKIAGFPNGVQIAKNTPAAWTDMPALTVDRALWHLFHWRSTLTSVCDIRLTGDARYASELASASASLWQQIKEIAYTSIFAVPGFDQYGRMFVNIHPQLTPDADRTWATIQTLLQQDWKEKVSLRRAIVPELAMLSSSGIAVNAGGGGKAYFSLSNGHVFKHYGNIEIIEKLLLTDQTQANTLAGLVMGQRNNQYPEIQFQLAQNNRMFTLFPPQFAHLDLAAGDTVRGITFSRNLLPKTITYQWNVDSGFLSTDVVFEAETFPELAVDGDVPGVIDSGDITDPPTITPITPPIPPVVLPPSIYNTNQPTTVVIVTSNFGVFYTETFNAPQETYDDVEWIEMNEGLDPGIFSAIEGVLVTPKGVIYCWTSAHVYFAPYLGGVWTVMFSYTDFPQGGCSIKGVGVNPNAENEIAVFGGRPWSWPFDGNIGASYMAVGNNDAALVLTLVSEWWRGIYSAVLYANDGWTVFTTQGTGILGSFASPAFLRFNSAGSVTNSGIISGVGSGYSQQGCPVGTQDIVYRWESAAATAYRVTVNATSYDDMATIIPNSNQGMASSPTGLIAMAGSWNGVGGYHVPYKTTDSGITWVSVAGTIPVGPDVWENCGDDNRFIFAGGVVIRLTMDVGTTYYEKEGNLPYVAPLCDIVCCRFVA